jgi:hypothetical protein
MKTRLLFSIFFFTALVSTAQQWMYTDLTEAKAKLASAALGSKIYIAGGDDNNQVFSLVEIYDLSDESWSYAELSSARTFAVGISCGSKVLFAGGWYGGSNNSDVVDIFDTITGEWTSAQLSEPRMMISAVSFGNKVLFAGGLNLGIPAASNVVDIYDIETGEWDTAYLSEPRFAMAETVVGNVAVFASGDKFNSYSDRVDFYDFSTNTWSSDTLLFPRGYAAAAALGDKVMIVGGMTNPIDPNSATEITEIYDFSSYTWIWGTFPHPRAFIEPAVTLGHRVYLPGGGNFATNGGGHWTSYSDLVDIYDYNSDEWNVEYLIGPRANHTVTSAIIQDLGYLIIAGGHSNNEFLSSVEILMDPTVNVEEPAVRSWQFAVGSYPNPTKGISHFTFRSSQYQYVTLKIYDANGREVAVLLDQEMAAGEHSVRWDAGKLPAGVYFYRLTTDDYRLMTGTGKIVKY